MLVSYDATSHCYPAVGGRQRERHGQRRMVGERVDMIADVACRLPREAETAPACRLNGAVVRRGYAIARCLQEFEGTREPLLVD